MSEESLFREVDEEVRRDEIENIWNKYGSWILALCLGVIFAVGGFKGWQYWQKQQAEAGGSAYFQAIKLATDGKTQEAEKAFTALNDSHVGYAVLASFKQAALMADAGKTKDAIATYDKIAVSKAAQPTLKQLAQIKAAYLLADTASLKDMQSRLAAFNNATSPWRNAARELIAITAYRGGDYALADRRLNEILADPQSTSGAKQRTRIFLSVLSPKLTGNKSKSN